MTTRALIVGAALDSGCFEFLRGLAASVDMVIAADGGGAACLVAGITPDAVLGDLDSLNEGDAGTLRTAGVDFVVAPTAKDATDLDLAIAYARTRGARRLTATGVTGGRVDHTLASVGSLVSAADLQPDLVEPDLKAWILAPEGRRRLALAGVGATVSLFAVRGPAVVTCLGFAYPLAHEALLPLSSRGLSNIITAATATVEVSSGSLLAMSTTVGHTPPADRTSHRWSDGQ